MGYLYNMKVTISESQFIRMVNNSKGWGLIGINEDRRNYSPKEKEEDDKKIERIINDVEKTGEFIHNDKNPDYVWLHNRTKLKDINKKEKFENVLNKIEEILEGFEDEKIKKIIDDVKQTGEFIFYSKNPDYVWLYNRRKKEKFENVLNKIRKILEEFENKKIERIIDDVKRTGEFSFDFYKNPDYAWLYVRRKKEKFENILNKIREILEGFEDEKIEKIIDDVKRTGEFIFDSKNPDYVWLYVRRKKEKFKNVLNKITELQVIIGKRREWWGEKTTKQILEQMGFTDIPRTGQHRIDDCRNSLTCKQYAFDVYLPYNETNYIINKNIPKTGIIFEYDGRQHFKPIDFYGGDKKFIERINNDREKNSYCKNKNIKLVRIPYTSKTRDDIKRDIVSALKDPNNFILTGDYPKLGWNK